jgi:putative PIN family toxin of toxin-antitoxin system
LRLVLDTNVLISAFVFPGGAPEDVYRLTIERAVELVTSPPLLAEFGRILSDKFGWESTVAEQAVAQVARVATVARPSGKVRVVLDDPTDDRVLEASAEGGAEVIVSGDRHLLRLQTWEGIAILKPADFLVRWGSGGHGV